MAVLDTINDIFWSYLMIALLLGAAVWFTVRTRGVQFRMIGEMCRLLVHSGKKYNSDPGKNRVSSFQAFTVSIASRVGTGNLAGVATAIALGGPGAVFWMWVVALLASANAFVESTLAQLFKVKGEKSFMGGPAYYISKGIGQRWWAVTFAVLISITFGLAFNSVQSNTISQASVGYGINPVIVGVTLTVVSLAIICGGISRISRISEIIVPVMAVGYILLALTVLVMNYDRIPHMLRLIVESAFGLREAVSGGVGMAIMMGVKRGLFSNEAGEGSAPNVAATASVSHPVKQGLIQTLGVYTDTLIICTCTAVIILLSGIYDTGADGIALTQQALDSELGGSLGSAFVAVAIFFFAFSSIIANYYYGETNIRFITPKRRVLNVYRVAVGGMVMLGAVSSLEFVWGIADITMGLMTLCNLVAILFLGRYAVRLLDDYRRQKRQGRDPIYYRNTIPEISHLTECWPDNPDATK